MGQPNPKGDAKHALDELTEHAPKVSGGSDCKPYSFAFRSFERCSRISTLSVAVVLLFFLCVIHVRFAMFWLKKEVVSSPSASLHAGGAVALKPLDAIVSNSAIRGRSTGGIPTTSQPSLVH